ncbi:Na+/H+ antiporter NhaC family protein [Neobacillus sp. PS3-34]|uniref:Na+/H+ antiporter NhaC family protein n=1 Tax=Neobacillus sp. PS3-34 TaxID=3070678 RepID=UPI0027E08CEB|nr:Na+/H+ antiporter NhaC family protein [Neobacillus sp. PS3-34]WML47198.1 Na+/H+ antiporter NhaC family protein [Neobacillus sp. PS3-34]
MLEQNFTSRQVLGLIGVTLAGILASVACNIPLAIGFLPGLFMLIALVRTKRHSFSQILSVCKSGINRGKTVIFILFLVSFLLPSWYEAGTINQLVSLSLEVITPTHFLLLTFIISMFFSMILGTSVGTLSSIGIPIITSAAAIHIALPTVAGALISGAFVGDRTSPFSSAHQLLSNIVEVPVKKQFRAIFVTTITAVMAGSLYYWILDLHIQNSSLVHEHSLFRGKSVSMVKFIPPAVLITAVLLRFKIIYAFMASIISACIIALFAKVAPNALLHSLFSGVPGIGGGLQNMYLLLIFLALAGAYNGLLEEYKVIQPLLDRWMTKSGSLALDTVKTIIATLGISLIAGNQTLPIILTGRSFLSHWSNKHSKEELARVMADSTMLFPAMIPWSVLALMCSSILGVSLFDYLPFAIFLWILPILTIIFSLGKKIKASSSVVSNTG